MAFFSTESKYFMLGLEAVRGTAVAPTKAIAVGKSSEFEYKLNLIPDEQIRGIRQKWPSKAGTKDGSGKISGMDMTGHNFGELLYSLIGTETVGALVGTKSWLHTFVFNSNLLQNPAYTFHIDRGMDKKMYNRSCVKSISMKGAADGKITLDADLIFQSEAAETFTLTPVFEDPTPFMFFQTVVGFKGSPDTTTVKDWSLMIDNGSFATRVLNGSQDISDILAIGKLLITGTFTVYFDTESRRTDFMAATSETMSITVTGGPIEAGQNYTLTITIPHGMYQAFPYGDVDGLLGAAVTFEGDYDVTAANSIGLTLLTDDYGYAVTTPPTITTLGTITGTHTGGTAVQVNGTNFVTGAKVYFGGTVATSIVFVNATEITCVTPAGSVGAALVTVINPDTGTANLPAGFTYS